MDLEVAVPQFGHYVKLASDSLPGFSRGAGPGGVHHGQVANLSQSQAGMHTCEHKDHKPSQIWADEKSEFTYLLNLYCCGNMLQSYKHD